MTKTALLCILDGWGPGGVSRQRKNGGVSRQLNNWQPGSGMAS